MINTVGAINTALQTDPVGFIHCVESEYYRSIAVIGDRVAGNKQIGVIMLAGPSASGKTTTAHILRDGLRERGIGTEVVSLDNFYLTADDSRIPLLPNGRPDFESVYSLDLDEIRNCISNITRRHVCDIPVFDFVSRSRLEQRAHIDVRGGGIVIIEGLHALNPLLLEGIDPETVLKIYISVNTPVLSDNGEQVLSSRQLRLIRRACRDHIYRGADLSATMRLWSAVVEGEKKYLYLHKDTADFKISTFHSYEPAIFRDAFIEMAEALDPSAENHDYVMRAAKGLSGFVFVDRDLVPQTSLLREFIPGGKYENV